MACLNPYLLSKQYTLAQIDEKITFYLQAIEDATIKKYSKDTTQGKQDVESADITALTELLNYWMKAKDILTGGGTCGIVSVTFSNPCNGVY